MLKDALIYQKSLKREEIKEVTGEVEVETMQTISKRVTTTIDTNHSEVIKDMIKDKQMDTIKEKDHFIIDRIQIMDGKVNLKATRIAIGMIKAKKTTVINTTKM